MPEYVDCYWLIDSRNKKICDSFLNEFFPKRKEAAADFPFPQYGKTKKEFNSANELMIFLESSPNDKYSIYWNNIDKNSVYEHAMIFYTDDGKMIFGVSTPGNDPSEQHIINRFLTVNKFLSPEIGCMTVEEPPPKNSIEFKEFCKNRYMPPS